MPIPSRARWLLPLRFLGLPVLLLAVTLAVSGCESSEERAQRHYESALALMKEGDVDRALVELRNVFKYNGFHKEARLLYAQTQLARGEVTEAYSQFLRLVEQYPDTLEARITLAELALDRGDWDEVERHGQAAIRLAPDDPRVKALAVALDYRKALLDRNDKERAAAAAQAEALVASEPDDKVARRVAIDAALRADNTQEALKMVEDALAKDADDLELRLLHFRLLATLDRTDAAGAELESIYAAFPDRPEIGDMLIQWYDAHGNLDGAEALLRKLAGDDAGPTEGHITLVRFLARARGAPAAVAELDRLIAATEGKPQQALYRAQRAGFDFDAGRREAAIVALQKLLEGAEATDQTRRIRLLLARMLLETDNIVGAREQIETVLAEDPGQVDALKMRARLLIDADRPDDAIIDLRAALDGAPRDPQIMGLMADAHLRAGDRDLAGERLALAVETSNSAPEYALPYARFLMQDGRIQTAESVLVAASKASPGNIEVMRELGAIWLQQENWPALQELLGTLSGLDSDAARSTAASLEAGMLMRQNRTSEGLSVLAEEAAEASKGRTADQALSVLVMAQIGNGQIDAARASVAAARKERPDSLGVRLLSAMVEAMSGNLDTAEAELRALIKDAPQMEAPVQRLVALLLAQGRHDEAVAVLDAGIAAQPSSAGLRLTQAGLYQADGRIDDARAIFEALYAQNSNNLVVANNLASLLADHSSDPAALDRAYTIARRLQGLDVPAFQDTYGWIEYRRGNYDLALPPLEAAAKALPDEPTVMLHLGLTYAALHQDDKARPLLERGLELGKGRNLPQADAARAALAAAPGTGTEKTDDAGAPDTDRP